MTLAQLTRIITYAIMALVLLILFLLPLKAFAAPLCLPTPANILTMKASPIGSVADASVGGCFWYRCYLNEFTPEYPTGVQMNSYCGNVDEIRKMGGRIATIIGASDPLRSAQTANQRYPIADLRDPAFEHLRQMMCSAGGPCLTTRAEPPAAPASAPDL